MDLKNTRSESQDLVDDYLDAALTPDALAKFNARLAADPDLRSVLAREVQLRSAMKAMPAPSLSPAAGARMLAHARRSGSHRVPRAATAQWPMRLALAASFTGMAILLGNYLAQLQKPAQPAVARAEAPAARRPTLIAMTVGEPKPLQLSIRSPDDFQHVNFRLELPPYVSLSGQPGVRELKWEGSLKSGVNVLTLPLVGERATTGPLLISVDVKNVHQELKVDLSASDAGKSGRIGL